MKVTLKTKALLATSALVIPLTLALLVASVPDEVIDAENTLNLSGPVTLVVLTNDFAPDIYTGIHVVVLYRPDSPYVISSRGTIHSASEEMFTAGVRLSGIRITARAGKLHTDAPLEDMRVCVEITDPENIEVFNEDLPAKFVIDMNTHYYAEYEFELSFVNALILTPGSWIVHIDYSVKNGGGISET